DLLAAPIVQEAVNNKLDADKQGDNDITVHVTADRPDSEMGDIIYLTMFGTTLEGEKVEVTALPQTVDNIPHNYEFKLSIAAVRKLVNTQVSFFYRLERSGSSDPLRSKRQFVQVTGAAHRLAAPIIEEAEGEFIDPTKTPINVRIPFDPAIEYGMGIELFLLGKSPDGSTFLPELDWHIPEEDEVENPEGFVITVNDYNLKLLDGGTLKGWYDLLIAEGDEILRRESLHTKLFNVGEPKFELDAPIVLGVANGFLDPATLPGGTSRLTIPRPVVKPWVANDEATWKWVGDISGEEPGSRTFNAVTAQQDWVINLDAAFVAQHIEPNRGSKITVRYQLWRNATDETSLSNPLVFTVGVALELLAPSIKENNGDSALNPLLVRDTLTIVVPDNSALLPTDEIIATWTGAQGTPAGGSHTSVPRPLGSNREFAIPNSVVAFNLNKDVKVSYVVIRDGKPLPSLVFDLTVLSMPQNELLKPIIKDADNNGEGPEFNVGNLTTNATYRMGVWPLIATGQYVWLRLKGTNADGSDYNLQIHTAPGSYVTDQWINQGYYERSIAFAGLRNLKDGSTLRMEFKAAFGKSTNESEAVVFPVRTYMIKALEDVRPDITRVEDSKGNEILPGATTVDTSIKLEGKGAKGQKVLIKDGNIEIGTADIDPQSGDWEFPVTGLALVSHSFTATAQYGNGQISDPWVVVVTAPTAPTITRVENSKGEEILPGATTVDTSIKLEGKGAKGQKVLIKDGNIEIGIADIDPQSGDWEFPVTGLSADTHSFTATAKYGSGQVSDPPRIVVVVAADTPAITSLKDESNWNIRENGYTVHTSVTLTGSAPAGQEVEVFLGAVSKGKAKAGSNSIWTRTVSGLSLDVLHTFKAIGQYANNPSSNTWRLTVLNGVRPAIIGAEDSKGQPISNDGSTVDTTVRLRGTATKHLEVEIFDGNSSTGKRVKANADGIWTVELTGLTRTKHVFKAKALYGSGMESGEWIVNVADLVDLVENFDSYPREKWVTNPGDTLEGTHTKLTVFTDIGREFRWVKVTEGRTLWMQISSQIAPAAFGYAVALKQGNAKSATIKGEFQSLRRHRIQIEFLQSNDVVSSILFFEGVSLERFERDVAPQNGQAFNAIKFVMTILEGIGAMEMFLIYEIAYRS
ncbi:TPA: hypothetical protein ACTQYX_003370, partial [Pseudomonas putida]